MSTASLVHIAPLSSHERTQLSSFTRGIEERAYAAAASSRSVNGTQNIHGGGVWNLRGEKSTSTHTKTTSTPLNREIFSYGYAYQLPKALSVKGDGHTIEYTSASDWVSRATCTFDSVHLAAQPSSIASSSSSTATTPSPTLSSSWSSGVAHLSGLVDRFLTGRPAHLITYTPCGPLENEKEDGTSTKEQWQDELYATTFKPMFDALNAQDKEQETIYTLRMSAVHLPGSVPNTSGGSTTTASATGGSTLGTNSNSYALNHTIAYDVLDPDYPLRPRRIREEEQCPSKASSQPPSDEDTCGLASRRFEVCDATEVRVKSLLDLCRIIRRARNMLNGTPSSASSTPNTPTSTSPHNQTTSKQPFYGPNLIKKGNAAHMNSAASRSSDSHIFIKLLLYVSSNPNSSSTVDHPHQQHHRLTNEFHLIELSSPSSLSSSSSSPSSPSSSSSGTVGVGATGLSPYSANTSFTCQSLSQVHESLMKKSFLAKRSCKDLRYLQKSMKVHVPYRMSSVTKLIGSGIIGVKTWSDKVIQVRQEEEEAEENGSNKKNGVKKSKKKKPLETPSTIFLLSISRSPLHLKLVERTLAWSQRFTKFRPTPSSSSSYGSTTKGTTSNTATGTSSSSSSTTVLSKLPQPLSSLLPKKVFLLESKFEPPTPHRLVQVDANQRETGRSNFQPKLMPKGLKIKMDQAIQEDECQDEEEDEDAFEEIVVGESTAPPNESTSVSKRDEKKDAYEKVVTSEMKDYSSKIDQSKHMNDSIELSFEDDSDFSITSIVSSPGPSSSPITGVAGGVVTGASNDVYASTAGLFTPNYQHATLIKQRKTRSMTPIRLTEEWEQHQNQKDQYVDEKHVQIPIENEEANAKLQDDVPMTATPTSPAIAAVCDDVEAALPTSLLSEPIDSMDEPILQTIEPSTPIDSNEHDDAAPSSPAAVIEDRSSSESRSAQPSALPINVLQPIDSNRIVVQSTPSKQAGVAKLPFGTPLRLAHATNPTIESTPPATRAKVEAALRDAESRFEREKKLWSEEKRSILHHYKQDILALTTQPELSMERIQMEPLLQLSPQTGSNRRESLQRAQEMLRQQKEQLRAARGTAIAE